MAFIDTLPVWVVAISIFVLRLMDVSLGTSRTITVVQGWIALSVLIGFFEVLIWITAVSQVIVRIHESPLLVLAYAGGFAAGNALGIVLERRLAVGGCVIRMISSDGGMEIAHALRSAGYVITSFDGRGVDGARTLLFTACQRRDIPKVLGLAAGLDPTLFYTIERFSQSRQIGPLPDPTGWRAVFKKK